MTLTRSLKANQCLLPNHTTSKIFFHPTTFYGINRKAQLKWQTLYTYIYTGKVQTFRPNFEIL